MELGLDLQKYCSVEQPGQMDYVLPYERHPMVGDKNVP